MKLKDLVTPALLVAVVCLLVARGTGGPTAVVAAAPELQLAPTGSISVSGSSAIKVEPDRVAACLTRRGGGHKPVVENEKMDALVFAGEVQVGDHAQKRAVQAQAAAFEALGKRPLDLRMKNL